MDAVQFALIATSMCMDFGSCYIDVCRALCKAQVKGVVKDAASNIPDPSEAVDKVRTVPLHYSIYLWIVSYDGTATDVS